MTAADCARFEALLESIHASVHAVAEGQAALLERCDCIESRLDRIEGKLEKLDLQLTAIDAKLTTIDAKLTTIDAKLTTIDAKLTTIDVKLTTIGTKLDTFSVDTRSRLESIETHLGRSGPPRPRKRPPRHSMQRRKAA